MERIVKFSNTKPKDKYLTRMEKEELKEMRHSRMSPSEKFRGRCASYLRIILLFGVPIVLSMVMAIILVSIYVIRPYALTRDFTRTTCEVLGSSVVNQTTASCSAGTDKFQPCVKIEVTFPTGTQEGFQNGIIMENEQALVNCNPCSYTFGQHGLFHVYQEPCESWKENFEPTLCVRSFMEQYGVSGLEYPCYFNPHNPKEVVRNLIINENLLIHAVSWPILFCCIYLLTWGFVCYDSKQCRIIDECIAKDLDIKRKRQQMARIHATQLKKQRLGQGLGVRSEIGRGSASNYGWICSQSRQISVSLPSLCSLNDTREIAEPSRFTESTENIELSDNDNLDLRHLDLAVSQQNINDLTMTYEYSKSSVPLTYENIEASLNEYDEENHRLQFAIPTLPYTPMSTFRRGVNNNVQSTGMLFNSAFSAFSPVDRPNRIVTSHIGSHSLAQISHYNNRHIFYQQQRPGKVDDTVSEDEIDGYYSVARKQERRQTFDMYSASNDSEV